MNEPGADLGRHAMPFAIVDVSAANPLTHRLGSRVRIPETEQVASDSDPYTASPLPDGPSRVHALRRGLVTAIE